MCYGVPSINNRVLLLLGSHQVRYVAKLGFLGILMGIPIGISVDKSARLIIRLLFGFASDFVFCHTQQKYQ